MVSAWVLVKVITNKLVPPAEMVEGVKVLATCGGLTVTVSTSLTEQTMGEVPVTQPAETLVFTKPAGGVMDAVLVIWVCADAIWGTIATNNMPNTIATTRKLLVKKELKKLSGTNF